MSTHKIDEYTEREAKHLLNDICHVLGIGGSSRTPSIVLSNVTNALNDEFCKRKEIYERQEEAISEMVSLNNLSNDKDAYLFALANWATGDTHDRPDQEDYGV